MRTLFLIFISFFYLSVTAQNEIMQDFVKLSKHYSELTKFSLQIEVHYISEDGKVVLKQSGEMGASENLHFSKFAGTQSLMLNNKIVVVNDQQHYILYNEFEKGAEKPVSNGLNVEAIIDSLWKAQENLTYAYVNAPKGIKRIYMEDKSGGEYTGYTVSMDANTGRLVDFIYHVKGSKEQNLAEVRIMYSNENTAPKFKEECYSFSYYLKNQGKKLTPADRFTDYAVIDQRQKELE